MKITLCGSIAFYEEMKDIKEKLETIGHEVKLPPHEVEDENGSMIPVKEYYARRKVASENDTWIWDRKAEAITRHFDKIDWADVIFVTNYDKNGVDGYIGGNTLIEMGVAFYLEKPIYLLKKIPEMPYKEEVLGMKPIVLNEDISLIK